MDFFHCNACFSQPDPKKNQRFFLTNCGHSFCSICVNNTTDPQCHVCKARCKVITLSNELPDGLKLYFGDLVKEIKQLFKVAVIQSKHSKIYMEEYVPKLESMAAESQKELSKVKIELAELKKHYQDLLEENQTLKKNSYRMNEMRNKPPLGLTNSFRTTQGRNKSPLGMSNSFQMSHEAVKSPLGLSSSYQMSQLRNKSQEFPNNSLSTPGRDKHFARVTSRNSINPASAYLTPSPSSASGYGSMPTTSRQGRNVFTPESFKRGQFADKIFRNPTCPTPPSARNSQPFVLSTGPPPQPQRMKSKTTKSSNWSSASSHSTNTISTLRKSRQSFLSKLNISGIY